MNLQRICFIALFASFLLAIGLTGSYFAFLHFSHAQEKTFWSEVEWKQAEYEADINAHASYKTAAVKLESGQPSEEYIAQAKAWHEIREMARRGALGLLDEDEFIAKRQDVCSQFRLKNPDHLYEHAVYQILLKWADWPAGFPSMKSCEEYNKLLEEQPEQINKLIDDLKQLAFSQPKKLLVQENNKVGRCNKPITEIDILELLPSLNYDPEPAITDFSIWFGNDESGFASLFVHNLFKITKAKWKNCWHPKWQLIGSCARHTEITGSDLDVVVVLNPYPEDAVNLEWNDNGTIKKAVLKDQLITSKRIIQLWNAFWKTCDQNLIETLPGDAYPMIPFGSREYAPAWIQISVERAVIDLIPALRASDGSHLYFSVEGDSAKLFYSNAAKAGRFMEPYMQWENFPEVIKLLKLLFREGWHENLLKLSNSTFDRIAFELAKEIGRTQWEDTQLIELLRACMDRLLWHLDSNKPLPSLNNPANLSGEFLVKYRNNDAALELIEKVQNIRAYSSAEIYNILQHVINKQSSKDPTDSLRT